MSLDNIQIPALVLQELYRNSLVDLNLSNATTGQVSYPTFSYLGNNQQHIIIVVISTTVLYLPEDELDFLLDILTACKLSMADIALVNLEKNTGLNYKTISEQLSAEKLILFGAPPSALDLPLDFPFYQVQRFNSQVYLSAPGLKELAANKTAKTKLWNCLKQVFSIG